MRLDSPLSWVIRTNSPIEHYFKVEPFYQIKIYHSWTMLGLLLYTCYYQVHWTRRENCTYPVERKTTSTIFPLKKNFQIILIIDETHQYLFMQFCTVLRDQFPIMLLLIFPWFHGLITLIIYFSNWILTFFSLHPVKNIFRLIM